MNRHATSFGVALLVGLLLAPAHAGAVRTNPFAIPDLVAAPVADPRADDEARAEVRGLSGSDLRGVILGSRPMANVDGAILTIGDALHGWRLVRVDAGQAVFERDGDTVTLALDAAVFDTGETP